MWRREDGAALVAGAAVQGGAEGGESGQGVVQAAEEVAQVRQSSGDGEGGLVIAEELQRGVQEGRRAGGPPGESPGESQPALAPTGDATGVGWQQRALAPQEGGAVGLLQNTIPLGRLSEIGVGVTHRLISDAFLILFFFIVFIVLFIFLIFFFLFSVFC